LYEVTHQPTILVSVSLIGPGLAAIGMAYRPEGTVFYSGRDLAGLLPWRRDAREEKAMAAAKAREEDITRDEIGDLGLTRPFSPDKVAQLDRVLDIADELTRPRPNGRETEMAEVGDGAPLD
jgi:hypothetical protein